MSDLTIPVNGVYFDQIKAGTKTEEYRLVTPFWTKRLVGRSYDNVVMTRGYPKVDEADKRLSFPWRGYAVKEITHPHFGADPVEVFAIAVEAAPTRTPPDADLGPGRVNKTTTPSNGEGEP